MKARELRELEPAELAQRIHSAADELELLKLKHRSGIGLDKPLILREKRRDLARMKTVKAEQEAKNV